MTTLCPLHDPPLWATPPGSNKVIICKNNNHFLLIPFFGRHPSVKKAPPKRPQCLQSSNTEEHVLTRTNKKNVIKSIISFYSGIASSKILWIVTAKVVSSFLRGYFSHRRNDDMKSLFSRKIIEKHHRITHK